MMSFIQFFFHSTESVSVPVSVSTVSRICFRNGVTLVDVVSVVILKIRTERTGMICPDRTKILRSDLAGSFKLEGDIFLKVLRIYVDFIQSSGKVDV